MKNATKILFGVVAIAFGIIYFGSVMDFWSIGNIDGWWTLIIIIPAIGSMISSRINYGNTAFLVFGLWLLVSSQNWVPQRMLNGVTISVLLVAFGIGLIYSEFRKKRNPSVDKITDGGNSNYTDVDYKDVDSNFNKKASESSSDKPSFFAAFGLNQSKSASKNLCGGDATAIFGGVELDLSDAVPKGNVTFNVNTIFGGVDIVPPKGYRIEVTGVSLLGGCDNKLTYNNTDGLPIFTIKYFTFCGGIDIVDIIK